MIKESRYLEIKPVYLQLNAPLFVLAGLNDILRLFQSEVASTKEGLKAGDPANEPSSREAQ